MEERIASAESRGAAPGLLFQSFLNAMQQKNPRTPQSSKSATESTSSESDTHSSTSNPPSDAAGKAHEDIVESETWKGGFSSTRRKFNQTWEQYSPTLKDKVQRYSPNPLRVLKVLFTLSEEKGHDYDAGDMEGEKVGEDVSNQGDELGEVSLSDEKGDGDGDVDSASGLNNDSSHKETVPSEVFAVKERDGSPKTGELRGMDHQTPFIVLQEPDSNGSEEKPEEMPSDQLHRRKSPLTVQEWVDHLPVKSKISHKDCDDSLGSKDLDNLSVADAFPLEEKKSLITHKLSREASVQSSSSLDSILDSRRPDPVEVLLNLGFGGVPGVDMNNCRIPKRFLVPSKCKGGDWNEFLKRELLQAQNFECASLGFRGLSGPSYRRPSAIVANIMEKLREQTTPRHAVKLRFSSVARRVLNEKSVLNKLVPPSQSVLSPDSRKFLDSQGKISPEVPRRRIIFGQKSFAFGNDGEFIEVESSASLTKDSQKDSATVVDSSSVESDPEEVKMNPATLPSPEMMLKIRRSSLQRQKKVEEEHDLCDIELRDLEDRPRGKECPQPEEKPVREGKKIPMRFVSSTNHNRQIAEDENLKSPEEIKMELEAEIKTLSQKIQNASSIELSSILLQMKELRTKLENSQTAAAD